MRTSWSKLCDNMGLGVPFLFCFSFMGQLFTHNLKLFDHRGHYHLSLPAVDTPENLEKVRKYYLFAP